MLDECLGGLIDNLRVAGLIDETLLAIVGARGFPLGEHRRIGLPAVSDSNAFDTPVLYEELVHVPWLLRLPHDKLAPARLQALVQPTDLGATLLDACGCLAADWQGHSLLTLTRDEHDAVRDRACCFGPLGERSLLTRRWRLHWREPADGQQPPAPQLFVKPDDRWEVNDVANRCPHVIEPLQQAFRDCSQSQQPAPLAELLALPAE